MEAKEEWASRAKRYVKAELKRREITYDDLAERLSKMGIPETEGSITMKIGRGTFPAWFFLATMAAIGRENVRIDDI
jgi:hypothetical protein